MQKLPKAVRRLIEKFEALPGIGPKSAQRLVFYLLHTPETQLVDFADKLLALKRETVMCSVCHNVAEQDPCDICQDQQRDQDLLCVVEQPLDLLAIERSGKFLGNYHVLHGSIAPLNNIGPDQLYLRDVSKRLRDSSGKLIVKELILATNPTMEGEATALYIAEMLKNDNFFAKKIASGALTITRIGRGLPIGADIEYADGVTLAKALEGRRNL
ncbi:MAG: Recombination protein RecR [Microgenomates bacterium 39_6]|nr:MAG: Recombination protein RecR [Microgenomates bacterium 39_6]